MEPKTPEKYWDIYELLDDQTTGTNGTLYAVLIDRNSGDIKKVKVEY